jgi:hypothetical protein
MDFNIQARQSVQVSFKQVRQLQDRLMHGSRGSSSNCRRIPCYRIVQHHWTAAVLET